MVRQRIGTSARQKEIEDRLAGWALQGGYLVDSYARLVGRRHAEDVAVVASSFTRLYDDVLDERQDGLLGERLARLFAGEEVEPASDIEWILGDLFRWLAARVPAYHEATLYAHLRELHRLQLEAVDAESEWSREQIVQLTTRKGGAGMAILGGLVNPRVEADEFAVLYQLGGLLQLIDDFDDAFEDQAVLTSANWSHVPFGALAAELRSVSRELIRLHGARRAGTFVDGLYNWLVLVGLRRILDRARRFDGRLVVVPRRSLAMITLRKQHIR
jgi:hypothetical protein